MFNVFEPYLGLFDCWCLCPPLFFLPLPAPVPAALMGSRGLLLTWVLVFLVSCDLDLDCDVTPECDW